MSKISTYGKKYEPKSGVSRWFDERLPLPRLMHNSVNAFPTPRNLNYWYTFGGVLTFCLITQIITGVVLSMHYTANSELAFGSVEHIMRNVNYGWLIRYIHAVGASMFFLAVYVHIFRGLYYGSYKAPRELLWILGVLIPTNDGSCIYGLCSAMGANEFLGCNGNHRPVWGNSVYWRSVTWLWGGFSVDNATLNRFFSLHYLLPFMIFGVVILHIWSLHVTGNNNPIGISVKDEQDTIPFSPYYTVKDAFALVCFLILFAWFVFYNPNILGHSDNYIEANPLSTPAHIVPEWYLLPFYAILRAIPSKIGGVIFMFSAIAILFLLPWLDTSKIRSATFRPLYRQFFWIFLANCLVLGYLGSQNPEGGYLIASRICTAYYFIHFLVVFPLLGIIETPKPLPESITKSVLEKI